MLHWRGALQRFVEKSGIKQTTVNAYTDLTLTSALTSKVEANCTPRVDLNPARFLICNGCRYVSFFVVRVFLRLAAVQGPHQ